MVVGNTITAEMADTNNSCMLMMIGPIVAMEGVSSESSVVL